PGSFCLLRAFIDPDGIEPPALDRSAFLERRAFGLQRRHRTLGRGRVAVRADDPDLTVPESCPAFLRAGRDLLLQLARLEHAEQAAIRLDAAELGPGLLAELPRHCVKAAGAGGGVADKAEMALPQ